MSKNNVRFANVLFALFLLFTTAYAQGTFSRFTGTVQDANGNVVENATVTLTNEATNAVLTTQTNRSGNYFFDSIQVGTYGVKVEKQGFQTFASRKNAVSPNQTTTLDAKLSVGDLSVVVTVDSAAEKVQTGSSGNLGQTVDGRSLVALPIAEQRGRNPLNFINYQPGVVVGANTGGGVHVNGARDRAFNFTLDGVDINETSAGGSNFTPIRLNPDAIQEFQIVTSNFTAELGRSSGAQVSFVTKAGTNDFRGTAFDFYQTPEFIANEYQNNLNGTPKRQFVQHIFGGSLGGAIIKKRAFFFTNLQLVRANETRPVTRTVYTEQARQGVFRYVVGGRNSAFGTAAPSVDAAGKPLGGLTIGSYNVAGTTFPICSTNPSPCGLDTTVQKVLRVTPLPNNFSVGDGLNIAGYNFNAPQRDSYKDFTVRGDYNFNDKNTLYARYSQGVQNTFGDFDNGGLRAFPETPDLVSTFRKPQNLAVNYRTAPTSRLTNELVFGVNRFTFTVANPDENFAENPPFTLNNGITNPFNNSPFIINSRTLRTIQFVDNLTYIFDSHTIKTGFNLRFQNHYATGSSIAALTANFSTAINTVNSTAFGINNLSGLNSADLSTLQGTINDLLGRIGNVSRNFIAANNAQYSSAGDGLMFTTRYPEYDFYGQDTWKIRSNLTLDYGLRWEVRTSPRPLRDNTILVPNKPVGYGESPANDIQFVEGNLYKSAYKNFAPSIGIAFDPFSNGKTSIRANYRLAYDRVSTFVFQSAVFQSLPGLVYQANNNAFGQAGGLLRSGLPNLAPPTGLTPETLRQPTAFSSATTTIVDPNFKYPATNQFSVSFQRDLGFGFVAEANYLKRRAYHLFGGYDANQVDISARDARFSNESFLEAFNTLRANPTATSPLINALLTGNATNNAGTTQFRSLFSTALSSGNTGGGVATVAQSLSQRVGANGGQLIAQNGFSPYFFQPYPQFTGGLNVLDSNDYSTYNALELILKRRFDKGLSLQFAYTLARSKDTRSFDPIFTRVARGNTQTASSTPFDLRDRQLNYARSDFDRKHSFQGAFVYELPFGKGRQFASNSPRIVDFLIGGLQTSGIVILQSGRPFTVFSGVNTLSNAVQSTANCNGCSSNLGGLVQESGTNYFFSADDRAKFTSPAPGETGNTGRNFFTTTRLFRIDFSIAKRFRFSEKINFELRADASNLTNTPSYNFPVAVLNSSIFGRIRDGVVSSARRIQLGGKINF